MTVQEYQERNKAIESEIAKLNSQAISLDAQAASFITDAQAWRNQKGNDGKGGCTGSAKKKSACEEDKLWKEAQATGKESAAAAAKKTASDIRSTRIPALEAEFSNNLKLMTEAQASSKEVSAILASQGQTQASVQTQAKEHAKADYEATILKAQAEASGIAKQAEADAENKKKMGMVYIAIAVVVVAIVGFILFKKFKKK